jgi:hypothetical protein
LKFLLIGGIGLFFVCFVNFVVKLKGDIIKDFEASRHGKEVAFLSDSW